MSSDRSTTPASELLIGLAVGLLVLCAILSVGAHAQSSPPPKPSGSVNIHQVQVAFIGSGGMFGHVPSSLNERFPTEVRATAAVFCYQQGLSGEGSVRQSWPISQRPGSSAWRSRC